MGDAEFIRERRGSYGGTEGRRPLGKPRCRKEDNIKMDFQEVRWGHGLERYAPV